MLESREDYLVRVASLYYEQDYNQEQIAKLLATSRSNVSRLLKEAKQKGLVEIRVRKPISTVPPLEKHFRERFGLERVMIVESRGRPYAETLSAAGQLAARYLEERLRRGETLAISWGTGVSAAVSALSERQALQVEVVQMIGSVGTVESEIDGHELARKLATKLGGRFFYLHAPLIVDSQAARDLFLEQPTISETLNRARRASIALLGIGTTEPGMSSFLRAGHLTEAELRELRAQGAVGETAGRHFDINGNCERFDINQRVIALDLADVKAIPSVIAVACGLPKRYSILGALRGGYIKALATDDVTALAVLEADGG
ncbi:MAG: sugar-binding transcriptional regulator [Anaerolineae bacterium]|nr:sugar-binding transcriptional regulator [Anaerolineae bacterium]MDW8298085.1 sugar-binding transcriptional regulator [Anaerolineae bacterium]